MHKHKQGGKELAKAGQGTLLMRNAKPGRRRAYLNTKASLRSCSHQSSLSVNQDPTPRVKNTYLIAILSALSKESIDRLFSVSGFEAESDSVDPLQPIFSRERRERGGNEGKRWTRKKQKGVLAPCS